MNNSDNKTIRRDVAARILQGMCANPSYDIKCVSSYSDFAEYAVKQADALLAELEKQ